MENFDFIEMRVPARAEYVGVVRLSVSGIASRGGFAYEAIEDLKVAVSEAITNVVEHVYSDKNNGDVTIGFGIYEDRLEVMVADYGGSFDLNDVKGRVAPYNGSESVGNLHEDGFGLFLIEMLMDRVEIHNDNGVIVLMTKYLHETEVDVDGNQISTTQ